MDKNFKFTMKEKKMTVEDGTLFDDFMTFHQNFVTNLHASEAFTKVKNFVHAIIRKYGLQEDLLHCAYAWDTTNTAMPMWNVCITSAVPFDSTYEMTEEEMTAYQQTKE